MTLGEHCDEIIRLIDEALTKCSGQPGLRTVRSQPALTRSGTEGAVSGVAEP